MFGYLRFILASMVVLSHTGVSIYSLSPGVMAVVLFYILAGFVVSHIYIDIIPQKNTFVLFIKDRLLRIYPLYLFVAAITIIFITTTSFQNPSYSITALLANLTIIPLNYYMYADFSILKDPQAQWWLIPPAWSLGTELQAYLLLALTLNRKWLLFTLSAISLAIYTIANLGIIHPDYFGYRFIAGVFFIFATGTAIQKSNLKQNRYFITLVWLSALALMIYFSIKNSFSPTYTKETLLALVIGIPLIYTISKQTIKLPFNSFLGSLSYGIFLTHFLSIWILQYAGIPKSHTIPYLATLFTLSITLALTGIFLIEKKTTRP